MGKATTTTIGAVRVELAQETFLPGETLVGTVYLHLPQPVGSATLKVRVLGRQGLNWLMARGNGVVAHGNKIDHLTEEVILAENTAFVEGHSVFPFVFELPGDLQHNFVYVSRMVQELQGVRASVQYEVEAVFSVAGSDVTGKASFRVNPLPMAVPFGRRVDVSAEENVKLMGLFQRGTCGVKFRVDMDVLDSSSTIDAQVTLELHTPQLPKFVLLALYEKVVVDRHNPLYSEKRVGKRRVCCRRYDKAALAQPEDASRSIVLPMHLPISPNEISDSDPLNPTMTSFFVDISYAVFVEIKFPMVPRISVGVPVTMIQKLVAPQELEVARVA